MSVWNLPQAVVMGSVWGEPQAVIMDSNEKHDPANGQFASGGGSGGGKSSAARKRAFPAYTTAQLKESVKTAPEETAAKIREEIKARESGESQVRVTPQVEHAGMKANPKVGRL